MLLTEQERMFINNYYKFFVALTDTYMQSSLPSSVEEGPTEVMTHRDVMSHVTYATS